VASPAVSLAGRTPDLEAWRTFFEQQVASNARFWLEQITQREASPALMQRERDNILKALSRALQVPAAGQSAVNLLRAFHSYMERQGALTQWEHLVVTSIELCRREGNKADEASLLDHLGELKRDQGEWAQAAVYHETASRLHALLGDTARSARALTNLGQVYWLQRKYEEATRILKRALDGFRTCEDADGQAFAHAMLGLVRFEQLQWDEALAHHQAAHRLWSEAGNREGIARAQHNMANAYRAMGNSPEAESWFGSAIALYEETHSRFYQALATMDMGNLYLEQGQPEQAETLYRQAREVMEQVRHTRGLAQVYNNLGMACTQQQKWGLAEDFFQRSIALWHKLGEPVSQANAEDNLAEAYLKQEKWQPARQILAAALDHLGGFEVVGRVASLLSDISAHLRTAEASLGETPQS
jgi:tetratricopeptide (TPR) repeat protein